MRNTLAAGLSCRYTFCTVGRASAIVLVSVCYKFGCEEYFSCLSCHLPVAVQGVGKRESFT